MSSILSVSSCFYQTPKRYPSNVSVISSEVLVKVLNVVLKECSSFHKLSLTQLNVLIPSLSPQNSSLRILSQLLLDISCGFLSVQSFSSPRKLSLLSSILCQDLTLLLVWLVAREIGQMLREVSIVFKCPNEILFLFFKQRAGPELG